MWYAFAAKKKIDFLKIDSKSNELGIFKDAFESGILEVRKSFLEKLLYCFRWGLQNLRFV